MLIGYPNYIGTIQSFIDCYITIPYIREIIGRSVQAVDDRTYAQHMLQKWKTGHILLLLIPLNPIIRTVETGILIGLNILWLCA